MENAILINGSHEQLQNAFAAYFQGSYFDHIPCGFVVCVKKKYKQVNTSSGFLLLLHTTLLVPRYTEIQHTAQPISYIFISFAFGYFVHGLFLI